MALFGTAAARAEKRLWADSRPRGAAFVLLTTGPIVVASAAIQRYLEELPADKRPTVRFLSDPDDYLKPIVFDPASPQWRN